MRHGNKINHLGRKTAHRKALLMNLSNALILHKRITTTVAKAKELRKHIEPLINKTKVIQLTIDVFYSLIFKTKKV
jgi:large subunit ribosomal protein L17